MKATVKIGKHEWTGEVVKEGKIHITIKNPVDGGELTAHKRNVINQEP